MRWSTNSQWTRRRATSSPAAVAYARFGCPDPARGSVAAIRRRTGALQARFACSIGIAVATLRNREQGRRRPEGPARVLLALLDRNPRVVQELPGEAA